MMPLPIVVVVRLKVWTKVAETDLAASIVTLQAPDPEQAPPHAVKRKPAAGTGVRFTAVPVP